jgi:hypothetical protein
LLSKTLLHGVQTRKVTIKTITDKAKEINAVLFNMSAIFSKDSATAPNNLKEKLLEFHKSLEFFYLDNKTF